MSLRRANFVTNQLYVRSQGKERIQQFLLDPIWKNIFFFGRAQQHAGSQLPNQVSNLQPLQWKRGVLSTGQPAKALEKYLCSKYIVLYSHPDLMETHINMMLSLRSGLVQLQLGTEYTPVSLWQIKQLTIAIGFYLPRQQQLVMSKKAHMADTHFLSSSNYSHDRQNICFQTICIKVYVVAVQANQLVVFFF